MSREFTVVVEQGEKRLIASISELPGCFTQGDSLDDLTVNVKEAIALYLDIEKLEITIKFKKGEP